MKPVSEYENFSALVNDARAEGVMRKDNPDWEPMKLSFYREVAIRRVYGRIVAFLIGSPDKKTPRTLLYKKLNLRRTGAALAEEALNRLYVEGRVYVEQDDKQHRGPKAAILVYNPDPQPPTEIVPQNAPVPQTKSSNTISEGVL